MQVLKDSLLPVVDVGFSKASKHSKLVDFLGSSARFPVLFVLSNDYRREQEMMMTIPTQVAQLAQGIR